MPYSVPHIFSESLEKALAQIENIVRENINKVNSRWISIKLFERDEKILEQIELRDDLKERIENIISSCEKKFDDDSESIVTNERYAYINKLIKQVLYRKNKARVNMSDRIDKIVTNRILALPIFVAIMFLVYYFSISTVGGAMTDWVNDNLFGDFVPNNVEWILNSIGTADWLNSFILDGIIAGVGAVLGFVPQMAMLFLCLAILEDCGYMARIAFIMDRLFRRFGLSGKSFIPILIGTGCGVPGIMSTRTIENEKDRRMTVIVTTFIPCSAKIPIIALIAGALFHGAAWVATSAYFIGIAAIIISGIILKKTKIFSGDPAPFIMELPPYHVPGAKGVLIHMWERSKAFMKKAGTVILLATVLVWFLSSFNWRMQAVDMEQSILASIGNVIAPIFVPLGWGNWKAAVASLTGLMAKENVVGTFGILYGFSEVAEDGAQVWGSLQSSFSLLGGYSLLVFNLLCAPCFAAMGAVRTEMNSRKWTLFSIGYQCVFAYVVSLIIFQIGSLVTGKGFGIGTAVAVILIIGLIYLLFKRPYSEKHDNQVVGGSIREKEVV
jgi:ferrous iron transport protein B